MQGMSSLRVDNRFALEAALQRAPGRPLITVSNHVAVSHWHCGYNDISQAVVWHLCRAHSEIAPESARSHRLADC